MKHMKKMISILLCIAVLVVLFTGCTGVYVPSKTVGASVKTAAIKYFEKQLTLDYPGYYLCGLNGGQIQISDVDSCANNGDDWTVSGTLLAATKAEPVKYALADYTINLSFIGYVDQTSDTFELKEYKIENFRDATAEDIVEMTALAKISAETLELEDESKLSLVFGEDGKPQVTIDSITTADETTWEATMSVVAKDAAGVSYSCDYKFSMPLAGTNVGKMIQANYCFLITNLQQTGTWTQI